MAYYLRFFNDSEPILTLDAIRAAVPEWGDDYSLDSDGQLIRAGNLVAILDVTEPTDVLFYEEIEEFRQEVEAVKTTLCFPLKIWRAKRRVKKTLAACKSILAVQVVFGDRDSDSVLDDLDELWWWLKPKYPGLNQADCEGFYEKNVLILEM